MLTFIEKGIGKWFSLPVLILFIILAGCSDDGQNKDDLSLVKKIDPAPMDIIKTSNENDDTAKKVKKEVAGHKYVYDVVTVKHGKTIIVAYKVKHLHRFQMKSIEKQVTGQLKKKFPDHQFIVSSDYKIFLESVRLNEMLQKEDVPEKKAKKKFREIVELKKELT
ncbi:YhcN/YlaJ family sporulation lipoprotein [Bacillus sp. MUM 13]|uniref:YhcN/YlaJ family sporulation lipoprotein n=1 Tax=Bacillus sp. MUM 13 TaxID=1678001 RepID=UPI0008F5AAD0|nr:YhcN/YlaJ family sporulation lipoprotein [Bacillus sp. MUM 13]OIK11115.1 hypothetical protein BIV59_13180 [Bacillus sp. MUM 13]